MESVIAKCGYRCDLCPAYETNLTSEEDKQQMCEAFAEYYGYDLTPEQLNPCKGCVNLDAPPDGVCRIFFCAQKKEVPNCAHCGDYPCEMLDTDMKAGEEHLGKLADMPTEKYEKYCRPFVNRPTLEEIHRSLNS